MVPDLKWLTPYSRAASTTLDLPDAARPQACCAARSCAPDPLELCSGLLGIGCPTLEKLQYEQYHHDYHNDDYQRAYHPLPPLLAKFPHEAWQRKGREPHRAPARQLTLLLKAVFDGTLGLVHAAS